ncbi:hypothetical protein V3C99_013811 [Haemonchus contortus]
MENLPTQSPLGDSAVWEKHNDTTSQETALNNMLFEVFSRMGVQSFLMKTGEGSLHGVANPTLTHFIPDEASDSTITNRLPLQAPFSFTKGRHDIEEEDLKVAVSGAQRNTNGAIRSQRPPFAGQRLAVRNPIFFRNGGNGKGEQTNGMTSKQMRIAAMAKT